MKEYPYLEVGAKRKKNGFMWEKPDFYFVRENEDKPMLFKSKQADETIQWAMDHIQTDNIAGAPTGQKRGIVKFLTGLDIESKIGGSE